jgi:diguanylate cyclase (GGDEF)-like protein
MNIPAVFSTKKISAPGAWVIFLASALIIISLGAVDYYTGYEFSLDIFYIIPIIFSAWFIPQLYSFMLAFISSIALFVNEAFGGREYSSFFFPAYDVGMSLVIFVFIAFLVNRLKMLLNKEREMARTDTLTGAYNSRYLYEILASEIERARRSHTNLALAYTDIDNFKKINDTFGHREGDALLRLFVEIIKENIRLIDSISRIGGDEFVILLVNTQPAEITSVFDRIQSGLRVALDKPQWQAISFSIGVVICGPDCAISAEQLVEKADQLMYEVKNTGKNAIKYLEL